MQALNNWDISNSNYELRREILGELSAFSKILDIVDSFFSALRIKTGINCGYCQIVVKPIGWEDRITGTLEDVYVISTRQYPVHFDNYGWLEKPNSLDIETISKVSDCFDKIRNNNHKRISLALSRLNRAYLRSREEDTILDITIAFETLLTHDSNNEITFRLASRVAALCLVKPFKNYNQFQIFQFCKEIYSFRSAVIHGNTKKIKSKRLIKIERNEEISTISLSIDLLRHTLEVLLENSELNDPIEIDKLNFKS